MKVKFTCVEGVSYVPERSTEGAGCYDLRAAEASILFPPHMTEFPHGPRKIPTGLKVEVPKGYGLCIFNRSGMGSKGVLLGNSVGIIDSDYRGEIFVPLMYLGDNDCYQIRKGDRIAQCTLIPMPEIDWIWADELDETERGDGGFGSTGD